jgi:hypothetical protein
LPPSIIFDDYAEWPTVPAPLLARGVRADELGKVLGDNFAESFRRSLMSRMTKEERREMVDLVRRMQVIQQAAEVRPAAARGRSPIRGARFGARGLTPARQDIRVRLGVYAVASEAVRSCCIPRCAF